MRDTARLTHAFRRPRYAGRSRALQFPNPARAKLLRGEVTPGSFLGLASPMVAEIMASVGFDWLVIDAEHGPWDFGAIVEGIRAIESRGCVPLVRPWSHDPALLGRLLDAGAMGLVLPHVSTRAEAEAIAQSVRYPPAGHRSSGVGRAAIADDYYAQINDNLLICPQIEDMEGVRNSREIMAVEGMDVLFIGPSDLAISMGRTRADAFNFPEHTEAIAQLLASAQANGKPAGTPVPNVATARRVIAQGFRMIDVGTDHRILKTAAGAQLAAALE